MEKRDFESLLINLEAQMSNFHRWQYAYKNHVDGIEQRKEDKYKVYAAKYTARTHQTNAAKIRQAYRRHLANESSRKGKRISPESQIKCLTLLTYFEQLIPPTHQALRNALTASYTVKKWWQEYLQAPNDYGAPGEKDKLPQLYTQVDYQEATDFEEIVRTSLKEVIVSAIDELSDDLVCVGIEHNRDSVRNVGAVNELSVDKPHMHIMIYLRDNRAANFLDRQKHAKRVKTLLSNLGIYFIESDAYLLDAGAIAPVKQNPETFVNYMLHKTPKSEADGKAEYYKEELFTNLSDQDLNALIGLYSGISRKAKLSDSDWDTLAGKARVKGQNLEDFDEWIKQVLTTRQRAMAVTKVVKADYTNAVMETLGSAESDLTRCSIVISGKGNTGKSYATRHALDDMGLKTYKAIKGNGKYDGLTAKHDAMIFDDIMASDARNAFENAIVPLYRRNHDLAIWRGKYAVVTTNLNPDRFICKTAGLHVHDRDEDEQAIFDAIKSRVYFAHIDPKTGRLVMDKAQSRGTLLDKEAHDELFNAFKEAFEKHSMPYTEQRKADDYKKLKAHFMRGYLGGVYDGYATENHVYFNHDQGFEDIKEHKYEYFKHIIPECFEHMETPNQFKPLVNLAKSWTDEHDVKIATDFIGFVNVTPQLPVADPARPKVRYAAW